MRNYIKLKSAKVVFHLGGAFYAQRFFAYEKDEDLVSLIGVARGLLVPAPDDGQTVTTLDPIYWKLHDKGDLVWFLNLDSPITNLFPPIYYVITYRAIAGEFGDRLRKLFVDTSPRKKE